MHAVDVYPYCMSAAARRAPPRAARRGVASIATIATSTWPRVAAAARRMQ
jgi:hypothetical protein